MVFDFTLLAYTVLAVYGLLAVIASVAGYFIVRWAVQGVKAFLSVLMKPNRMPQAHLEKA